MYIYKYMYIYIYTHIYSYIYLFSLTNQTKVRLRGSFVLVCFCSVRPPLSMDQHVRRRAKLPILPLFPHLPLRALLLRSVSPIPGEQTIVI